MRPFHFTTSVVTVVLQLVECIIVSTVKWLHLPSNSVNAYMSTMWIIVCCCRHSQTADMGRRHLCTVARHGPQAVQKQLSRDHVQWGQNDGAGSLDDKHKSFEACPHGRRSRGRQVHPRISCRGTLVQIVPRRFLSYRYKKERSVAFEMCQNSFSAGDLPQTPLGELTTLPKPPSWLERGHPHHTPTLFDADPPSVFAMRPLQNSSQIYAYACLTINNNGLRPLLRWVITSK